MVRPVRRGRFVVVMCVVAALGWEEVLGGMDCGVFTCGAY